MLEYSAVLACESVTAAYVNILTTANRSFADPNPAKAFRDSPPPKDCTLGQCPQDPDRGNDTDLPTSWWTHVRFITNFEVLALRHPAPKGQRRQGDAPYLVLMDGVLPRHSMAAKSCVAYSPVVFQGPIILSPSHDTYSDTILGSKPSGANYYLAKPFRFAVLLARPAQAAA